MREMCKKMLFYVLSFAGRVRVYMKENRSQVDEKSLFIKLVLSINRTIFSCLQLAFVRYKDVIVHHICDENDMHLKCSDITIYF